MNISYLPEFHPKPKFDFFWFMWGIITVIIWLVMIISARAEKVNLEIIVEIESNGNPLTYNHKSKARGLYQITEICLKDYNQENNAKISPQSLFNPKIGELVAKWYLTQRIPLFLRNKGIPITLDNLLIVYNFGIGNLIKYRQGKIKLPAETQVYLQLYKKLANDSQPNS